MPLYSIKSCVCAISPLRAMQARTFGKEDGLYFPTGVSSCIGVKEKCDRYNYKRIFDSSPLTLFLTKKKKKKTIPPSHTPLRPSPSNVHSILLHVDL